MGRSLGPVERGFERVAFRRCVLAGAAALSLGLGGEWATGGRISEGACSGSAAAERAVSDAIVRFESSLPFVQLGQYLGRALLQRLGLHG